MPSHHRTIKDGKRRGVTNDEGAEEVEDHHQQQQRKPQRPESEAEGPSQPGSDGRSAMTAIHRNGVDFGEKSSHTSVLVGEEYSRRLATASDEHLTRILAYTDFYDALQTMQPPRDALAMGADADAVRGVFRAVAGSLVPTSPAAPPQERVPRNPSVEPLPEPTRGRDAEGAKKGVSDSDVPSTAGLTRVNRDGATLDGDEEEEAGDRWWYAATEHGDAVPRVECPLATSKGRLQAKHAALSIELQASQEALLQLNESLQTTCETLALHRCRRMAGDQDQRSPRGTRPQRATLFPLERPLDVADFFWALRVAPDPAALQARCACPAPCHASLLAGGGLVYPRSRVTEVECGGTYGSVGDGSTATPADEPVRSVASSEHLGESEVVATLLCESAWVDTAYHCYNVRKELRSVCAMLKDDDADRIDGGDRLWPMSDDGAAGHPSPANDEHRLAAAHHPYELAYLQRLWVTSVLRHLLLLMLVTLACVLLFVPGVVVGTLNTFDAAEDEDFYASRNRFGRSAMLVVAREGSCTVVFLCFFGLVGLLGRERSVSAATAAQPRRGRASTTSSANDVDGVVQVKVPSTTAVSAADERAPRHSDTGPSPRCVALLVQLMVWVGTALLFGGVLLLRRGCRTTNLVMALWGQVCYGAGEALLLGGIGTIVCAEVGVAAGATVSLLVLLLAWLLANALGSFAFPSLVYYVYTTASMLNGMVYTTGCIAAPVFGLVMLCSRDVLERAMRVNMEAVTARRLWRAARHHTSVAFHLRALTVSLLTSIIVLLLNDGLAVFVPPQAVKAQVSASARAQELMSTRAGSSSGVGVAHAAAATNGQEEGWVAQQQHAPALLFAVALLAMPMCFIPRLALCVSRWCPVAVLTTLLCIMWAVSTGASWGPVLQSEAMAMRREGTTASSTSAVHLLTRHMQGVCVWLASHPYLDASVRVCSLVTGTLYVVCVSSLLRSMANVGVPLPMMHPSRWRRICEAQVRARTMNAVATAPASSNETAPLLPQRVSSASERGGQRGAGTSALNFKDAEGVADALQRCVRAQLQGGPALMVALTCLLTMMTLLVTTIVMTVTTVLLTSRDELPVHGGRLLSSVTVDEHLITKTMVACISATAMGVQWVEVVHRRYRTG